MPYGGTRTAGEMKRGGYVHNPVTLFFLPVRRRNGGTCFCCQTAAPKHHFASLFTRGSAPRFPLMAVEVGRRSPFTAKLSVISSRHPPPVPVHHPPGPHRRVLPTEIHEPAEGQEGWREEARGQGEGGRQLVRAAPRNKPATSGGRRLSSPLSPLPPAAAPQDRARAPCRRRAEDDAHRPGGPRDVHRQDRGSVRPRRRRPRAEACGAKESLAVGEGSAVALLCAAAFEPSCVIV